MNPCPLVLETNVLPTELFSLKNFKIFMKKYFKELKNRFLILLFSYICTFLITYLYKEILLFTLIDVNLIVYSFIVTNIIEIFSVYIDLLICINFQIIFLFLCYHVFVFLSYAFLKTEYYYTIFFIKLIILSWLTSLLLASYLIIPMTWNFFLDFQNLLLNQSFDLYFEPKLDEYLTFCISLYYICTIYFQVFLTFLLIFSYMIKNVKRFRKLYYFGFVIFSTLISPPDIISQIFISCFLILFYESLLVFFIFKKTS